MAADTQRSLPDPVRDLALRLGATWDAGRDVHLTQSGIMRQDATSAWMKFTARQTISTTSCAFEWRARTGPLGLVSVRDALVGGEGQLDVKALGFIPVAHIGASPAITRGELMRYLAELPLAPDAILCNPGLRWRSEGADRLVVGAGVGETAAEVTLTLDRDGRIADVFAPNRPRGAKAPFTPTPWQGRFADYRQHLGVWLPFSAEVSWTVKRRQFVYWQGRMESWRAG